MTTDTSLAADLRLANLSDILAEDSRRREARAALAAADSAIPAPCLEDPDYRRAATESERRRIRLRHDFPFWARECVRIRHKLTGKLVPFDLNAPQRLVVRALERQRLAGKPLRIILLKSRQWGGSTVIQMYMAWIQCVLARNWHSLICAQVKDTSSTIRGMYSRMLANYPEELWSGSAPPAFTSYEGSRNTRVITGRDCLVTIGSAECQESSRGSDIAMAHLSEVAFWKDTRTASPDDLIRSVCSGIPLTPLSMIAMESTANGVGNFFHSAWLRARAGESAYSPVFVPWHGIEMYSLPVTAPGKLIASLSDYEAALWSRGLTLPQIAWYHSKRAELVSDNAMHAEYPSDDVEAFVSTTSAVFNASCVEELRKACSEAPQRGEMTERGAPALRHDPRGGLHVWRAPDEWPRDTRFVTVVDVGGRSDSADWSVIAVIAAPRGALPEVAAQWRGHIDHDLLAKLALRIGLWYRESLLVIESNTFETGGEGEGTPLHILEQASLHYPNIYRRRVTERDGAHLESRIGFHTNTSTKPLVITGLIAAVRDGAYIERDGRAVDELLAYERRPNGSYGARRGHHDDILMTRAIGLYVISRILEDEETHGVDGFISRHHVGPPMPDRRR